MLSPGVRYTGEGHMVPLGQPGQFSFDGPDSMESPPRSDENTSEGADSGPVGNTDCPAAGTALAATDAAGENTSACATPTGSQQIEPTAKVSPAPEAQPAAKPRPRGKSVSSRNTSKSEAINLTLAWLSNNYEQVEGMCLPRSVLYTHYVDFCKTSGLASVSAASFGKVIRQKFPNLTTRRLGTRGQSKYHYYGIGIKETSPYYNTVYSRKGMTRFSATTGSSTTRREYGNSTYSPSTKSGTLLPEFPSIKVMQFSTSVLAAKVDTFLVMYRTHCQRILDTVVRSYFLEVQEYLLHFWQGVPGHLLPLLASPAIVELIAMCDVVTYQALIEVLIPSNLQPLAESLNKDIQDFSRQLPIWLRQAMMELPQHLQCRKAEMAGNFCNMLRRQVSLVHLAQGARGILRNCDSVSQLLQDWRRIDVKPISLKMNFCMGLPKTIDDEPVDAFAKLVIDKFEQLLVKQGQLEAYLEWMDNLVEEYAPMEEEMEATKARNTLIKRWAVFGQAVSCDMTCRSANSFGPFHLMFLTLQEYLLCLAETMTQKNTELAMLNSLTAHQNITVPNYRPLQFLTPMGTPTIPTGPQSTDVFNFGGVLPRNPMMPVMATGSNSYLPSPSGYRSVPNFETTPSDMPLSEQHGGITTMCMSGGYGSVSNGYHSMSASHSLTGTTSATDLTLQHVPSSDFLAVNNPPAATTVGQPFSSMPNLHLSALPPAVTSHAQGQIAPTGLDCHSYDPASALQAASTSGSNSLMNFAGQVPSADTASGNTSWRGLDDPMSASSVSLHTVPHGSTSNVGGDLSFMSVSTHNLSGSTASLATANYDPVHAPGNHGVQHTSSGSTSTMSHPNINAITHPSMNSMSHSNVSTMSHPNISRLSHASAVPQGPRYPPSQQNQSQSNLFHPEQSPRGSRIGLL